MFWYIERVCYCRSRGYGQHILILQISREGGLVDHISRVCMCVLVIGPGGGQGQEQGR